MAGPNLVLVPGWLERSATVGWRVLATVGMVLVLALIVTVIPVSATATLVSLVFAAALAPTALRLRARGLPRPIAAAGAFGAGALIVIAVVLLLVLILLPDLRSVAQAAQQGLETIRDELAVMGAPQGLSTLVDSMATSVRSTLTPDVSALVGTIANLGTILVLGTFLTYFLLADGDKGWAQLTRSLPDDQRAVVDASARTGLVKVAMYVRRTALLAAVDGLVAGVVLFVLGVPFAGALGVIAFLAGFVPYLGAAAGGAIIGLAALALGGTLPAVAVLVALGVDWVIATRMLESTSMSRQIDVHPIIVLVALPTGLALFGILGLLALLPVTVFALAVTRSVIAVLDLQPDDGQAAGEPAVDGGEAPPVPEDPVVPRWLDRLAQWSWRGLVLAALAGLAIAIVVRLPSVVVPTVIAVVGAATLLPVVDRLAGRGWSRGMASGTSTIVVSASVTLITIAAIAMTLGPLSEVMSTAVAGASSMDLTALADGLAQAGGTLQLDLAALFVDLAAVGIALILALLLTFFFLRDGRAWWQSAIARLSPTRRAPIAEAGGTAVDLLAGYMGGTAVLAAFNGASTGLILWVLGLPLALPITVLGFFAGFIPYIGSFVSTGLALLVTIALGTVPQIVFMLVFTVIFNIVQGNILTPLVYGRSLSLHPAVVLMAVPVGNEIAGILGMFLVVPVAAVVAATWRLVLSAIDDRGVTGAPPATASSEAAGAENLTPSDTVTPLPSSA